MPEERNDVQTFKGTPLTLVGPALEVGTPAAEFTLVANDLSEVNMRTFAGKVKILNIVPSLDTPVCDRQTRRFNEEAAALGDRVVVLAISRDLPFAQKRWCAAAGIDRVQTLSAFRHPEFGVKYGVLIKEGPLASLLARSVFVIDGHNKLAYQQIVPELAAEPDYAPVLEAARRAARD